MTGWQRDPLACLSEEMPRRGVDRTSIVRLRHEGDANGPDDGYGNETAEGPGPGHGPGPVAALDKRWLAFGERLEALALRLDVLELERARRLRALRARSHDLAELREALGQVQRDVNDPSLMPLLGGDGPLSPFLTGIYIWCDDVLDALEQGAVFADPWEMRTQLDRASHYYFDGLVPRVREELEQLHAEGPSAALARSMLSEHLEELFFAARWLYEKLDHGLVA